MTTYHSYLLKRTFKGYLLRQFFIYPKLKKYLSGRVLDYGCGIGDFLHYCKKIKSLKAVGCDINEENIVFCKSRKLEVFQITSENINQTSDAFDVVIMDNVIEHIEKPKDIILEINRILKTSGYLIIAYPGEKGFLCDDDHKVYYTENSITVLIKELLPFYLLSEVIYIPFKSSYLEKHFTRYSTYSIFKKHATN